MTPTTTKKSLFKSAERKRIEQIFEAHGVPGWLGWGTYGAESSFGTAPTDEGFGFGLIEPSYNGKSPRAGQTYYNAEISAEVYQGLLRTMSLPEAVWAYSGHSYHISRPFELSGEKGSSYRKQHGGENTEGTLGEPDVLPGVGALENLGNPLDSLVGIGEFFKGAGELLFTPEGWLRIGKMLGGAIFFLWGVDILVRQSTAGNAVRGGTIGTVAKVAEVVK